MRPGTKTAAIMAIRERLPYLPIAAIAERLGTSPNSVSVTLHREAKRSVPRRSVSERPNTVCVVLELSTEEARWINRERAKTGLTNDGLVLAIIRDAMAEDAR